MGRFARSGFVRKLTKFGLLVLGIWVVCHLFTVSYQFVNSNGIHGIVAKRTMEQIKLDSENAQAYQSIPDYTSMQ